MSKVVHEEERRFAHTLDLGLKKLEEDFAESKASSANILRRIEQGLALVRAETQDRVAATPPGNDVIIGGERLGWISSDFKLPRKFIEDVFRTEIARNYSVNPTDYRETKDRLGFSEEESELIFNSIRIIPPKTGITLGDSVEWRSKEVFSLAKLTFTPVYPGYKAFKLYDTFGLPLDFIEDAARDQGIEFDRDGFERAMALQRERARASWRGGAGKATASPVLRDLAKTVFEGYAQTESAGCEVLAIVKAGAGAKELRPGEEGEVVLDHTPFYADSGGQVGDTGWLMDSARNVIAEVRGCTLPVQGVRAHQVVVRHGGQPITVGDKVVARVNAEVRQHTMRNHTATHLLHAALREILGKHVKQAGSLVDPAHLRFDFSHFTGVADEELQDIEDLANKEVLRNEKIQVINDVPIDVAVNEYHAMALFGEKYGERVRVIKIGDFSTELCGGIHTGATGEIGLIKVLKEGSVSSGVRRVEAVTGEGSLRHFRKDHELESVVGTFISTAARGAEQSPAAALRSELERRDEELKKLRKELEQSRMKSAASAVSATGDSVRTVKGVKVAVQRVENVDRNQMRVLVDNLRNKLGSGVVVLGTALGAADKEAGRVAIVVGVTKDLTDRVQAGKIVGQVAQKVGGKGGGRPDLAEAGGPDAAQLDAALDSAYGVVDALLS
ncbi:MAG: hypothetical protein HYX28_09230 [Candidatus Koribacter versatilis]|uniref:Alanine--tRNA ligase n=1 Tax=Candidatus Korobacter versatilis TaxID=658062 RepID=A0A932A9C7_9BACT|nr:hypothetical protein [Candidatus Koribacter versatilis]